MPTLRIHGGTVLDPERGTATAADLLIDGDTITAVQPRTAGGTDPTDQAAPTDQAGTADQAGTDRERGPGGEVIDATGMLVLPGFVDTHRHTWQAPLRGTAPDLDLGGYLRLVGGTYGPRYRPEDVYAGTLLGALECLDAGITTLFDWAHVMNTPEHADAAVAALRESGIRALFGYGSPAFGLRGLGRWAEDPRRVRDRLLAADDGLVTMALAPAGPSLGAAEDTVADYRLARELGVRISPHVGLGTPDGRRAVEILDELGLLGPDITYVHGNQLTDRSLDLLAGSGGGVAVAPAVEARMGHGPDPVGRMRSRGIPVGLGVDVVTTVPGDLFNVMRAALVTAHPHLTTPGALRLATGEGAAALGLAGRVGALRPGLRADVVLLRTDGVALAPVNDPVAAVVGAGSAAVDTVLVGGQVRKRGGRLLAGSGKVLAAARSTAEYVSRTSNVG